VFEDSQGGVRSCDSLGNDVVVRSGGIVWLQAASGALHQEIPAKTGREVHGAQIFVNLSSKNKLAAPRTHWLESRVVPEWQSARRVTACGSWSGRTNASRHCSSLPSRSTCSM
jgi:redox-sensitive bicupin YhaK (pirin superfamily)